MSDRTPRAGLRVAEALFRAGTWMFHHPYDRGWRRPEILPQPVLSVGNLAVGGTGKTPAVRALAGAFLERGRRPAVLTRGYRARRPHGVLRDGVWEDGGTASAADAGDEPLWLSRRLPGVPVVVGRRRAAGAAALLAAGVPVDVWILDDGFQHRRLHRDLDLVLLDVADPLGNGRLLPAGPLREPPAALSRAGVVLLTGGTASDPVPAETRRLVETRAPGARCLRAWTETGGVARLGAGEGEDGPPALCGRAVWAVAGIARPGRFTALLAAAGADLRGTSFHPDHHPFTGEDVRRAAEDAARAGAVPVTTEKDAVRLLDLPSPPEDWWVVGVRTAVEGGWDAFAEAAWTETAEGGRPRRRT